MTAWSRPKLGAAILAGVLTILAAGQVSASTGGPPQTAVQGDDR
jgi:hypothetical protein